MKKYNCRFSMCMWFLLLYGNEKNVILLKERDKKRKRKKREGQNGGPIGEKEFSLVNGSHNLKLIYKRTTQQHYLKN